MRQRRDGKGHGYSRSLPAPLRPAEEDERRSGRRGNRERERVRERTMRERPSVVIDVGEDGTCSSHETNAPGGRALLRPGSDRESDRGMRDRGGHRS